MRFLLYNIRYGAGTGARFHLPLPYSGYLKQTTPVLTEIIDFIREVDPDVAGLVEVDNGSYRAGSLSQAGRIADALGYRVITEGKYGHGSVAGRMPLLNQQGNALLFRLPLEDHRFHFFEHGVKRLVIEARFQPVTVFLVHLSLTFRKRQYQLDQLHQLVRGVRGPVIVAGDFNVLWGARELNLFLAATGLKNANREELPSHPSRAPKRQLDYILHSPDLEVTDFRLPAVRHSDHAPLVCDFRWMPSARPVNP